MEHKQLLYGDLVKFIVEFQNRRGMDLQYKEILFEMGNWNKDPGFNNNSNDQFSHIVNNKKKPLKAFYKYNEGIILHLCKLEEDIEKFPTDTQKRNELMDVIFREKLNSENDKKNFIYTNIEESYNSKNFESFMVKVFELALYNSGVSFDNKDNKPEENVTPPKLEAYGIQRAILKGSRTNYNNMRGAGGRFYHLNISDTILPEIKDSFIKTNVKINGQDSTTLEESIENLWGKECWHALLTGLGGMGKTVSLLRLWKKYLNSEKDNPVPVFIALNEYNNSNDKESRSFIIESIGRDYMGQKNLSRDDENLIWDLFKGQAADNERKVPSVILLLDGYNELTVDKTGLLIELNNIIKNCKGVQVLITSRTDIRENINLNFFNRLDLIGLDDLKIEEYLSCKIPQGRFLELLRNPMMLTIYHATCHILEKIMNNSNYEVKKEVRTAGEMLWNFIEGQLAKKSEDYYDSKKIITYRILLKHVLPYIGWEMERQGKFYFSFNELKSSVKTAFERLDSEEFFGTFHYYMPIELQQSEEKERFVRIKETIVNELAMMVEEKNNFGFLHQNFRDFFAAVHILNGIKISLNTNRVIPNTIKDAPISCYVSRFIGEIEGEHYNVPQIDEEKGIWSVEHHSRTNLTQVLDICRGRFDGDAALAIWNVIEIWKDVRGELTGADLSNLDLSKVNLNIVKCSRLFKETYTAVNFDGSLIDESNILFTGHSDGIESAIYSNNGKRILSASLDGTIKEWDTVTGKCIKTYKGHSDWVTSAVYSNDEKRILSASFDGSIREWDTETGECNKSYQGYLGVVKSAVYSNDSKKILSASSDGIKEWDTITGECIKTYQDILKDAYSAIYSSNGKRILSASFEGIREWDTITGECIKLYKRESRNIDVALYSSDGKKIISANLDGIKEWDAATGKCIKEYARYDIRNELDLPEGKSNEIYNILNNKVYSSDGKKFLSIKDETIYEFDTITEESIKTYKGHSRETSTEFRKFVPLLLTCRGTSTYSSTFPQ